MGLLVPFRLHPHWPSESGHRQNARQFHYLSSWSFTITSSCASANELVHGSPRLLSVLAICRVRVQLLPWHSKPLTEFENAPHSMPIDEWGYKTPPVHKKFTILPSKKRSSVTNTSLLSSDQLQGFENLLTHALGQNSFRNVLHGVTDSRQVLETHGMVLVRLLKTRSAFTTAHD